MSNKVVVYSKESCVKCNMTKKFLTQNNIPYEEVFVDVYSDDSTELMQQFRDAGFKSFPVVSPNGTNDWSGAWCDYQLNNLRALVVKG